MGLREVCVPVGGRAGGRTGIRYVITKFSLVDSLPNFVTHGAPLHAHFARARTPLLRAFLHGDGGPQVDEVIRKVE